MSVIVFSHVAVIVGIWIVFVLRILCDVSLLWVFAGCLKRSVFQGFRLFLGSSRKVGGLGDGNRRRASILGAVGAVEDR